MAAFYDSRGYGTAAGRVLGVARDASRERGGALSQAPRRPHLPFPDRHAAGRELGARLQRQAGDGHPLVLGLPRGGVPVGYEVALALQAPLDVFVVRKLGVPGHEELAMGAVASGGARVLNEAVLAGFAISPAELRSATEQAMEEVRQREALYREGWPALPITGRPAILVDDGLATGASMRVAIAALRAHRPARVIVAVPVAPAEVCDRLRGEADELTCLATPEPFEAVGLWYRDFTPVSTEEVRELVRLGRRLGQA